MSYPERAPGKTGESQSILVKSSNTLEVALECRLTLQSLLKGKKKPPKFHSELQPLVLVLISLCTDVSANISSFSDSR